MSSDLRLRCARLVYILAALFGVGSVSLAAQQADCGDSASVLVTVLDEAGSIALPGAIVIFRWTDAERVPVREVTDADGRVRVCVPRDASEAVVWAEFGDHSSVQAAPARLTPGEEREIQLRIFSSVPSGRLIGRLVDRETDRPVATAVVRVVGRTDEVASDRRGRFRLTGVPAGQHELRIRRLGYAPLRHTIEVISNLTTELEIGLVRDPVALEPLIVSTTRSRRLEIKGFYERRHWGELLGLGTFYTVEDIERRNPLRISHMVEGHIGIRTDMINARTGCGMKVYLDNLEVGGDIDQFVLPLEVAGVEIYRAAASLAAEFGGSDSRCGVVAVWTK